MTETRLRARVLYYYAASKFAAGQTTTTLSEQSLARLLEIDAGAQWEFDEILARVFAEVGERLDVKRSNGRVALSVPARTASKSEAVSKVLEHWRRATGRKRALLTASRKRLVAARFREGYTTEQLIAAIDALAASDWHSGQNDRGTRYDDVSHFAKNAETVDRWLSHTPQARRDAAQDRIEQAKQAAAKRRRRRERA